MAVGILIKEKSSSDVKLCLFLQTSILQTEDGKSSFYLSFLCRLTELLCFPFLFSLLIQKNCLTVFK